MARLNRKKARAFVLALGFVALCGVFLVQASNKVPQTWMPGVQIFNNYAFTQDLPVFGPVGAGNPAVLPRVNAVDHPSLKVRMIEIDQQVFPAGSGVGPTRV